MEIICFLAGIGTGDCMTLEEISLSKDKIAWVEESLCDLEKVHEKKELFCWILSKWGGGPCPIFLSHFQEVHFGR